MMHRSFKIRNAIRSPKPETPQKAQENPLSQLVSLLKNFFQAKPSKPYFLNPKNDYQVEARDKQVFVELPDLTDSNKREKELKLWVSNIFKTVCSSIFNYFSKNEMNFEQAKIYCSENILKNITVISEKYHLDQKEMKMIDNHIKKGVLTYLAAKYPLTDSTEINKKLQAVVKEVDNIESLQNNYFTNSKIVFEYRESENYNDLIMQMLNDLMGQIDQLSEQETTNYQQFEEFMSDMFQRVTDEDWMKKENKQKIDSPSKIDLIQSIGGDFKQTIKRKNEDKDKYRNKVKEYTNYAIGRKISENTPHYTQREIENDHISIKSPHILRILTKWCEQLYQKYNDSYFSNRSQSVKVQRGQNINSLLAWMREQLDQYLEIQKKQINSSMSELFSNNYEMQAILLQNQLLKQGGEHVNFIQRVCGKFSYNVVKNLHTYIITYLNKLIHGLLKVSKGLLERNAALTDTVWPSPPNLLSFKIGDLMRCKFTSKQRQILRIYKQINRISRQNPEKMKIVRIKNRLRMGTNDILMNIRFNNQILCEIQLGIITKTSDFIKCSNMFHHYLYQLQRSLFGPLTELCSIWNSLDRRANIFENLVQKEQNKQSKQHQCLNKSLNFSMKPHQKPFICSKCQHAFTHSRFIKEHKKCSNCSYLLCSKCNIQGQSEQSIKKIFAKDKIKDYCDKRVLKEQNLPKSGFCTLIQSKNPKGQLFTIIDYRGNSYLLGKQNGQLYEICKFKTQKDKQKFRKQYLIFHLIPNKTFYPIILTQARNKYIIPLLTKHNFSKEKQSINLMDLQLKTDECRQILSLGTRGQKQTVKNVFLTDNNIQELPFKPEEFPNIEWITLSRNNNIITLKGIQELQHLNKIILTKCKLKQVHSSIYNCKNINQLGYQLNNITEIDDRISQLQSLDSLQFGSNKIKVIPQSLFQCKGLKMLSLKNNLLTSLPQSIQKLEKLQSLILSSNNIVGLPQSVGQLKILKKMYLNSNKQLNLLPSSLSQLKLIQYFDISQTGISNIPINEEGWINLKYFKVTNSKMKQFSSPFQKSKKIQIYGLNNLSDGLSFENLHFNNIKRLNLSFNHLTIIPNLCSSQALKFLDLSNNTLKEIPSQNLQGLFSLEQFICRKNLLTTLPHSLSKMSKLQRLDVSQNQLKTLLDSDFQSTLLLGQPLWPSLKQANLFSNKFQEIPLCLCYHSTIINILIKDNNLHRIRPQVKHMTNLTLLNANKNQIEEIPQEIAQLAKLQTLHLWDNKIKHIPSFIKDIPKLQKIEVYYCPIQTIDQIDFWAQKSSKSTSIKKLANQIKEREKNKMETNL